MAHHRYTHSPSGTALPQPQQAEGRYRNAAAPTRRSTLAGNLALIWQVLFAKPSDTTPQLALPVEPLTREQIEAAPEHALFRLGHSTVLLKLGGAYWLTDPVFAERASPVQWAGPRRFHAAPISIAALPPLRGVILSHDHYDHLDRAAIRALAPKTEHFVTPLGVGDRLRRWGVPAEKIHQLDWWQSIALGGIELVATPAQHFSGRGLRDRNRTLWASWAILHPTMRVFFSGDSGYFPGFSTIGERLGPFDVTLMETGAYNALWPDVHMAPEHSLQAHLDVQGRCLLPIHNGTFDLALHPWHEPFERIAALAAAQGVSLATPRIGQMLDLRNPTATEYWWRRALVAERGAPLRFAQESQ
jgi:L-ascorbate metabolism protein UlaG (beta-lactamase superfamily)